MGTRAATAALLGAALLGSAQVAGGDLDVEWDRDLAFEHDRENYQRLLRDIVEKSYAQASAETGLRLARPLRVRVYAPARYEKEFGSGAAWTRGAHYRGGAITVNGGSRLHDGFAGLMVHEMTHALLDYRGTSRALPLWLNEGLAERLAWRRKGLDDLAPNQVAEIQYARRRGELVPLPTWGRVRFDYLQCYAAVLFVEKRFGREKLMAVVRRALLGEPFERALDRELRWTPADLEREFVDWVDHL